MAVIFRVEGARVPAVCWGQGSAAASSSDAVQCCGGIVLHHANKGIFICGVTSPLLRVAILQVPYPHVRVVILTRSVTAIAITRPGAGTRRPLAESRVVERRRNINKREMLLVCECWFESGDSILDSLIYGIS